MNHRQRSDKRQTIRIKLPPKPAAPRHPQAIARAISATGFGERPHRRQSPFVFPMVQVTVASVLSLMVLDMGECSQVVLYAALGYAGGLLMMVPRREALTPVDEFLIRWGFAILCVISFFISRLVWALRGYPM